ncbi:hypothetical protein FB451DRAFT_1272310 [Mycena latifolia]|nr:hypothetical protein FB451DRAFT_1272310 [Mycena latifolia]
MSSPNSSDPIQVNHAIHPLNKAYFKAVAASSKHIRTARNNIKMVCTKCRKNEVGLELRRCGKCKGVWYCSKECQTQDWPKHKKSCKTVEGSGMLKLVENFCSNPVLHGYLQACFILDFELLRRPHLDEPFMARVDLAIEPADITDFFDIFLGQDLPDKKVMGMVQFSGFSPATPAMMSNLTPQRKEMWCEARATLNTDVTRSQFIGLVEMGNGDSGMSITLPMVIQRPAMQMVEKAEPFQQISAITGQSKSMPFSVEACMEFINMHIRADKENQLLLRTEMRPADIQAIRDAAANSNNLPARILREKMARENIYRPLVPKRPEDFQ